MSRIKTVTITYKVTLPDRGSPDWIELHNAWYDEEGAEWVREYVPAMDDTIDDYFNLVEDNIAMWLVTCSHVGDHNKYVAEVDGDVED